MCDTPQGLYCTKCATEIFFEDECTAIISKNGHLGIVSRNDNSKAHTRIPSFADYFEENIIYNFCGNECIRRYIKDYQAQDKRLVVNDNVNFNFYSLDSEDEGMEDVC